MTTTGLLGEGVERELSEPDTSAGADAPYLVLVSFTNAVASPESLLALVDISTGYLREIGFGYDLADFGATGLTALASGEVVVGLPGTKRLVRLRPDLSLERSTVVADLDDAHSLTWTHDSLLTVATGRDSVLELSLFSDPPFELVAEHALSSEQRDSMHVNSVAFHQGHVLVSTFGEGWRVQPHGAPIGQIRDLSNGSVLSGGLSQPHTLVSNGGHLYVLGSFSGTIEEVQPDGDRTVLASYPGYLRGLVVDPLDAAGALVGVSGKRRRSRGLGTENVAGPEFDARCGILRFGVDWERLAFIDLSWFGNEIFDLLPVDQDVEPPTMAETLAAAQHRSLQLAASWEAPPGGAVAPTEPIAPR